MRIQVLLQMCVIIDVVQVDVVYEKVTCVLDYNKELFTMKFQEEMKKGVNNKRMLRLYRS